MTYTIHSGFAKQFDAVSDRFRRWPVIRSVCRVLLRLLLLPAYFGLLLAPAGFFSLPFQILNGVKAAPPSIQYWTVAGFTCAGLLYCLYRLSRRMIWELRQHVFDLESVVGFAGFLLSAAFTAYILPVGWDHY